MAYIYCAAVYCDKCGDDICKRLSDDGLKPENVADQYTYDSGDYPKSADVENEESDTPHHCDTCGLFMENPLTLAGYEYVEDALDNYRHNEAVSVWGDFYGFTYDSESGKWTSDEMASLQSA